MVRVNQNINTSIKHLHIMTNSNYAVVKNYIRFINEEFNTKEHVFLIRDSQDNMSHDLKGVKNIIWLPNAENQERNKMFFYLKSAEHIYWHYMQWTTVTQLLVLLHPSIFRKSTWIAWGADLYNWEKENKTIKVSIRNFIMYLVRARLRCFVGIFPPDIEFFKKKFKSKAKTYYAPYVDGLYNPIYKKEINLLREKNNNSCVNILVGHSATKVLNHIETLECIYKFKDENIKIYLPLSYGNMQYGDQVEEKAKSLFGDKVVCFRKMMSKENYMEFLSTIDIAIFNTTRQIGLFNIQPLIYMQKKIFINSESAMYDYYRSIGIKICDYKLIKKSNFDSFTNKVNMSSGKQYIELYIKNKDKMIEMWSKVFNM